MQNEHIPVLKIGDLEICPPIIQGGMGVQVSGANLAAAVAETGCAGVIASAGLGQFDNSPKSDYVKINVEAFRTEIKNARAKSSGIIGVNIMVALSDYSDLVKLAVEENVDLIISGAGLPLDLPQYLDGKNIKLIPVVSSARTFKILCKRWKNHFDRLPDAVIVEGPSAGGHLGYSYENVTDNEAPSVEQTMLEVIEVANSFDVSIPVIAAGGIYDGKDIARFLKMGASGVQMATRFVCTDECDAHDNFKQAYLDASKEDLTIIKSPVGLPGRVMNNDFVEQIKQGQTVPFKCEYRCLRNCEPEKAPYCIAKVLTNASRGELKEAFAFAGTNAYKCTEIVPVRELVKTLSDELVAALADVKCSNA